VPLDTMFGADGRVALEIRVSGLRGGHSGVDIHLQRGNSIRLLARALDALWREFQFELADLAGGNLTNAIPREARALVRVTREERAAFERALADLLGAAKAELAAVDPGLAWEVAPADEPREVWSDETTGRVLALLAAIPHGVERMSDDLPGLVESSSNLARVGVAAGELRVAISNRSSVGPALAELQRRLGAFARLAGGRAEVRAGYPGWKPNLASPALAVMKRVLEREFGAPPELLAIHAGLECGILSEKLPGADLVSFGPTIEHPHSPDERVHVPSVERFWRLLVAALGELAA
jgi:dipeptidase D